MVALQHLFDAAVEALDHAVGWRVLRWGQAVFDAKVAAQQIELVLAWIAARTLGVVVALAIVLEPMADNGSIVKMDQHGRTPFRKSLRTDLAMKNADRRGSM